MNRRNFIVGAAGLAAASVSGLAGCGSGGSGSSSDGGGGDVTLQMVESLTNPARSEVLKKLLGEFEAANPGIKVQLVSPPTEQADQKIQQMLQAGSGADVLEVRDLTVGPFANNGWLYDMTADVEKWAGFAELTQRQRDLLVLLLTDPPPSYAEISARLGIPVGAIGPTRARAVDRLRHSPALAALMPDAAVCHIEGRDHNKAVGDREYKAAVLAFLADRQ